MKAKILYEIKNLLLGGNPATINHPHFTLSNDSTIRDSFYTERAVKHFGESIKVYNRNDAFIYSEIDIEVNDKSKDEIDEELMKIASINIDYVNSFLMFLWLTKDNSVTIMTSLIMIPEIEENLMCSNIKLVTYNCSGASEPTSFSFSEIKYTLNLYEKYGDNIVKSGKKTLSTFGEIEIERDEKGRLISATENKIGAIKYSSYNCVDRAMHFLSIARNQRNPAFRISFYVPILESLFTTDSFAVTHKVCERVSIYMEEEKDKRRDLYDFISKVYNTRSTFLHGQKFSEENIDQIISDGDAVRLDEIIRASMIMIMLYDYDIFTGLIPKGNSPKKTIEKRIDFLKYLMFP